MSAPQTAQPHHTSTPETARAKMPHFNWQDPFLLEQQLLEEAVSYTHLTLPTIYSV